MDSKNKIVKFDPTERMAEKAEEQGWKKDIDIVELDMNDLSNVADAFQMIKGALELLSNATGVSLDSV